MPCICFDESTFGVNDVGRKVLNWRRRNSAVCHWGCFVPLRSAFVVAVDNYLLLLAFFYLRKRKFLNMSLLNLKIYNDSLSRLEIGKNHFFLFTPQRLGI